MLAPAVALTAVLGDQTGYFIGRRIGPALFKEEDSRFFKRHHVTSRMLSSRSSAAAITWPGSCRSCGRSRRWSPGCLHALPGVPAFDIVGGILWGGGVTVVGHFLGNVPFIDQNLEKIMLGSCSSRCCRSSVAATGLLKRRRAAQADERAVDRRRLTGFRVARGSSCPASWCQPDVGLEYAGVNDDCNVPVKPRGRRYGVFGGVEVELDFVEGCWFRP